MKKVLAAGTFDVFHKGHEHFLSSAKKQGDWLLVIVARDETVQRIKGRIPQENQEQRFKNVKQAGIADEVRMGKPGNIYDIVKDVQPDIICLGYDQQPSEEMLLQELKKRGVHPKVMRLDSFQPDKYKSSKVKRNS